MEGEGKNARDAFRRAPFFVLAGLAILSGIGCVTGWEVDRSIPFSPDDRAIAYRHRGAIYVARTYGEDPYKIHEGGGETILSSPHWAPGDRGLAFAVSDGKGDEKTGLLDYTLWHWPAPQAFWESAREGKVDSVGHPSDGSPSNAVSVATCRCRHEMQVWADALFAWHADGRRLLCLDADETGRQQVLAVNIDTGLKQSVSPVQAQSLAFSLSPDGQWLLCASQDTDGSRSGLWLGPLESDVKSWGRIVDHPGPERVPWVLLRPNSKKEESIYDLRPRLGAWAPDSKRFACVRLLAEEGDEKGNEEAGAAPPREPRECLLVVRAIDAVDETHTLPLGRVEVSDLKWSSDGLRLGVLAGNELLLVEAAGGMATRLACAARVQRFVGWSAPGTDLAYLTFPVVFGWAGVPLPSGRAVTWLPTLGHTLVVARADGTFPEAR